MSNTPEAPRAEKAYPLAVGRRRRYLFHRFELAGKKVLELGALDMPTFELHEADVDYMDYYSDEEFRAIAAKGGLSRPLDALVSVKHAIKDKYFANRINDRYDLIIAAHVIEHIPDTLAWLSELADLLTPEGCVFLAIPDRRYTLDYLRRESTAIDLIRNFHVEATSPDLYTVADFFYYKRNIRGVDVWRTPDAVADLIAEAPVTLPAALAQAERALVSGSEHANIHCTVFSHPTFAELWKGITQTGIVGLDLQETTDVQRDGNEFWTLLRKRRVVAPKDRRATKGRKFLTGRDDVLFLDNDTNGTIAQMTGAAPLDKAELGKWERVIRSRKILLQDTGAEYAFVIAPAKEAVLHDYLPEGIQLSDNRPAVQLSASSRVNGTVQYPIEVLRELGLEAFPKGESHWTDLGGLMVTRSILAPFAAKLGLRLLDRDDFDGAPEELMGDLATHARAGLTEQVERLHPRGQHHHVAFHNRKPNRGNMLVTENPSVKTGTAVLFRDSFAQNMIPFFAATFSRCVFVWNPFVDYDLVEEERPVLVLNIMAERFLPVVPDDVNKFSWEQVELMRRSLA
jgi:alginate O-acetyltransferase complex protein AlgJ